MFLSVVKVLILSATVVCAFQRSKSPLREGLLNRTFTKSILAKNSISNEARRPITSRLHAKGGDVLDLDFEDSEFPPVKTDLSYLIFGFFRTIYLYWTSFRSYFGDVLTWLIQLSLFSGIKLEGSPKSSTEEFTKCQHFFVEKVLYGQCKIDTSLLPKDYEYFGNHDDVEKIEMAAQTNPFYAMALKHKMQGSKSVFVVDSSDKETWFGKICATMSKEYDCVGMSGTFEAVDGKLKLTEIKNEKGEIVSDAEAKKKYTAKLFHLMTYYAESVHVNFHLFQYIMIEGIIRATRHSIGLKFWSRPYEANVIAAYVEAKIALIKENSGAMVGGGWATRSRDDYISVLREINADWGNFKSSKDYIEKFMLKDVYNSEQGRKLAKDSKLLSEFLRHADLVPNFSTEMEKALMKNKGYDEAKKELADFFNNIGGENPNLKKLSSIDNFKTWIELMSVTGIFHGATLSMTRILLSPSILSCVDPTSPEVYSGREWNIFKTGATTLVGAERGRFVFSDEYFEYKFVSEDIRRVAKQYTDDVFKLKEAYYKELNHPNNEAMFRRLGFLLSDYAPEFVDGKQLTIATYF